MARNNRFEKNIYSLQQTLHHYSIPTLVLCLGVVLSIAGFLSVLRNNLSSLERDFRSYTSLESSTLQHNLDNYQRGLELVQRFFQSSDQVTEEEFRLFVNPLFSHGHFDAFWWVPHDKAEGYNIGFAKSKGELINAPKIISEASFPSIFKALQETADTGNAAVSEPFAVKGESEAQHIAMIYPVTKNDMLLGAIIGVLNYADVFNRSMEWSQNNPYVRVYVFNEDSAGKSNLIYSFGSPEEDILQRGSYKQLRNYSPFHYEMRAKFPGQSWMVLFVPTPQYAARAVSIVPWVMLVCGLIISLLIGLFLFYLVTRSLQVKRLVDVQTRELRQLTESLTESEGKFRAIVDNTVDGLITVNERGVIKSFNPSCERIFGYSSEEVVGQVVSMLMPEPYRSEHDQYLQTYRKSGLERFIGVGREMQGRRKDGSVFPLDLSVSEVKLDDRRIFSGIVRDISQRKEAERKLRKTAEALTQSNQELEQFAYVASHDLKAPLRGIDNLSKWLMEDLGDSLEGENRENLELLRGRVARMEKLLDDLLEYSRASRKMNGESTVKVSGRQMLDEVLTMLNVPKGFTVEIADEFDKITVQDMPLRQVFHNLIGNAIKHHDRKDGRIEISFEDEPDYYHFRVFDDGPGIPKQFHNKVFQMFQTLKPRDEVEGSGVGLALVEKIITQYGGEITLISDTGIGTTFLFTWPKENA